MGWGVAFGLGLLAGGLCSHLCCAALDRNLLAQLLLLRRQLAILRRGAPKRLPISAFDRFIIAWICCLWPRALASIQIVRPGTVLRWHREGFRLWWRWKSRNKGGRPKIGPGLRDLIRRMADENPLWGTPRVHGELLKLGFELAQSTVAKYMPQRPRGDGQRWKTLLRNHANEIAAIDMLTVPTISFGQLYAFVVLALGRRKILHVEVTYHPTAEWLARQITEAFPWDMAPRYIVRDNDGAYGEVFRQRLFAMGIRDNPTAPHSPWQNGYVERVIGSIRRECLDHVIVFGPKHLRRLLRSYADYYNNDRTHLSMGKDSPNSRSIEHDGAIFSRPLLGGLHHRYVRIPAG
jgi:transposase InsO family protein